MTVLIDSRPVTRPITLTETLTAIEHVLVAVEELADVEPALRNRIEANRRRSARHHDRERLHALGVALNGHANGNGSNGHDVALKLTHHGVTRTCRCCGAVIS